MAFYGVHAVCLSVVMVTNPQAVHATVEASKEELSTPRECSAAMGGKVDDLSELSKNLSVPAVSCCNGWRIWQLLF